MDTQETPTVETVETVQPAPAAPSGQEAYSFPELGITVRAASLEEAIKKASVTSKE